MSVDTAGEGSSSKEISESGELKDSSQIQPLGEETINERSLEGDEDRDSPDNAISEFSLDEEGGAQNANPSDTSEEADEDEKEDEGDDGDDGDEDDDKESFRDDSGEKQGDDFDVDNFDHLVEKELESVGLGKKADKWRPGFSLDKMIEGNMGLKSAPPKEDDGNLEDDTGLDLDKRETGKKTESLKHKRETKHRARTTQSEKYKKLLNAVKKMRQKREGEELIGKMYGGDDKAPTDNERYRSIRSRNRELQEELDDAQFEEPLVFSVD